MIQTVFGEKVIHLFCGSKKFYTPIICLTVWDFHLSNPKQLFSMNNTKPLFIVRKHDKSFFLVETVKNTKTFGIILRYET